MESLLQKNKIIESVSVCGTSSDGAGVCRIEGRAVFVPGAIEGETVSIKILKVTSSAVFAKLVDVISPSPDRVDSDCPYFPKCGGCSLRYMSYEKELAYKLNSVNEAFKRIGGIDFHVSEIIPSPFIERYRNKGIYAVGSDSENKLTCGFYRQKSHDIIGIDDCLLQKEDSVRALKAVETFCRINSIPGYNEETGKGTLRHVFTRSSREGKLQVCLVAAGGFGDKTAPLVEYLREKLPGLNSVVLNVNKKKGNSVFGDKFFTLWGCETLNDSLCSSVFEISPAAFFQINPFSAENLYEKAAEFAGGSKDMTALDLYCGAGTITLRLAKDFGKVIGAEIVNDAIENANNNARNNGIYNTEFICADAGKAALELAEEGIKPDVIVVDPPRKGMDSACIEAILRMSPDKIVYVSCNPATQARDVAIFAEKEYVLSAGAAVDMFPRTSHVETVVALGRKEPKYTYIEYEHRKQE